MKSAHLVGMARPGRQEWKLDQLQLNTILPKDRLAKLFQNYTVRPEPKKATSVSATPHNSHDGWPLRSLSSPPLGRLRLWVRPPPRQPDATGRGAYEEERSTCKALAGRASSRWPV